MQSAQRAALDQALDLTAIGGLLKSHRTASRSRIAQLQQALDAEGLQTQSWRQKHTAPRRFDGIAGKLTVAALDRFQRRHGLLETQGRVDAVTAAALGLPPLGPEIFFPPTGPQSPLPAAGWQGSVASQAAAEQLPSCQIPARNGPISLYHLLRWEGRDENGPR
jgi:peptidoglycan hydrolase-like protein with peptidoglycan-binding domain